MKTLQNSRKTTLSLIARTIIIFACFGVMNQTAKAQAQFGEPKYGHPMEATLGNAQDFPGNYAPYIAGNYPPECDPTDCDIRWNTTCVSYNFDYDNNYYSDREDYFSIEYPLYINNEGDAGEGTIENITINIKEICFYWRVNCEGILEIQPAEFIFGRELYYTIDLIKSGEIPAEFQIPTQFMVEQVFEEILRKHNEEYAAKHGYPADFEALKNEKTTQYVKTSIGSCWAHYTKVTPYIPPDEVAPALHSITIGLEGWERYKEEPFTGHRTYYYAPCAGTACCSELFYVSWDENDNANIGATPYYRNESNCKDYKADVLDDNGFVVLKDAECEPVCDWHNFAFDLMPGIPDDWIVGNVYVSDNTISFRVVDYTEELEEIDYIITDMYGNEILNISSKLSKNLMLKSDKLPNGNYHIGIFNKDKQLLLNRNINLVGD